jgi:hypothetical protein
MARAGPTGGDHAPTVIFIAGEGHSGSTLLDLLIGSHSEVVSAGELMRLAFAGSTRKDTGEQCTCGATTEVCGYWRAVNTELGTSAGLSIETLDLHSPDDDVYRCHNLALLSAISAVSGRSFVVDSSKKYYRLERLLAVPELDVRVVHLVRHPAGVVYSHIRRTGKASPRYGLGFSYLRGEIRMLRLLDGQDHQVVRYEDLADDTGEVLETVMSGLGLEYESSQLDRSRFEHHSIGGNPMRFARSGAIAPDLEWEQNLGTARKLIISAVTFPVRQPAIARLIASGRPTARQE